MKKTARMKVGMLFAGLAVFAAAAAIAMLLWNALIPSIIGWTAICYWQAAGLMILCRLLFGGMGRFGHMGHMFHRCGHHSEDRERMMRAHEKMRGMSREERREFIRDHMAGFAASCGDSRERGGKYSGEDQKGE